MTQKNPFVDLNCKDPLSLPESDRFSAAGHLWNQKEVDALIFAQSAGRPLLVRGEAGCGKSQIARAAATVLGYPEPIVEVIHPRYEAMDLLYRVDALERLADAQLNELDKSNKRYVKHGALWQAMETHTGAYAPVLLIDEIDKADSDVPNALLDVLGNRSFTVPLLENKVVRGAGGMPLIIITTNEERELPPAFVRRCAVLNLNPPSEHDQDLIPWLEQRGRVHRHLEVSDSARKEAARQVLADRKAASQAGYSKVGLAEYIDLLTALDDLTRDIASAKRAQAQSRWLKRLSAYALVKHPNMSQDRAPAAGKDEAD